MKLTCLAAASVLLASAPARAAHIPQYVTATITGRSTVDTLGIFGPAGADLSGQKLTIYYQYSTARFDSYSCGTPSCALYFSKGKWSSKYPLEAANTPASLLIEVGVGSSHHAFAPSSSGSLQFNNSASSHMLTIGSDANVSGGLPTASVTLYFPRAVAFGSQLSPGNTPINPVESGEANTLAVGVPAPGGSGYTKTEMLTFSVTTAEK